MKFYRIFEHSKKEQDKDQEFYEEFTSEQLILRDYLSIERTILTNESTFLAYIRTSLTLLVVGVTLFQLAPNNRLLQYLGIGFALFGFYLFLRGSVRSSRMKRKIDRFMDKKKILDNNPGL